MGNHQGRHRDSRWPHRRDRKGRQSRHHDRCASGSRRRAVHRNHQRQPSNRHRRHRRLSRALDLSADHRRSLGRGHHHDHRRWHRTRRGHQGHHSHSRRVAPGPDAGVTGRLAGELRAARQGKHRESRRTVGQLRGGASGFKLHEDWGSTPAAIDTCLAVADVAGVQVALHSDTLNETGFVEDTIGAIAGRSIHAYHTEGAGGGHAPDIITVAAQPNVLPSSTNPTRPHTVNTLDEHLDMLMVCHHLNPRIPEDLAFAESRIRPSTIAAEDVLHDMGAISMIGSDSQAMGRVGEVVLRTWQTAHVMKARRGALEGDPSGSQAADNNRVRRYIAKYTICPAIAHGMDHLIGSVEVGKLADLVLWEPAFFGVRPHVVLKGGAIAWAAMGDANASIPTPQPVLPRPMFGAAAATAAATSVHFVAPQSIDARLADRLAVNRGLAPVADVRAVGKTDLPLNDALPSIEVDPDTFTVRIDGQVWQPQPAAELPMTQRYFLF
ncbi:predicted protein [Mycobacterium tuberculosis 94_M4241A]|nr:predicted protein [Mycobacterium tuberculosis 94_M4241A]